jgi:hypothetical protein
MALYKSIGFLPEVHNTKFNKKFLAATLDQLISEKRLRKVNGLVGRKFGAQFNNIDSFVQNSTAERNQYQLEPTVVFKDANKNIVSTVTYPDVLNKVAAAGGFKDRADAMFSHQSQTFTGLVDLDKFVNFSQYYWLPNGPDSVDIFSSAVPVTNTFQFTYTPAGYVFDGSSETNPYITVVQGGNYTLSANGRRLYIQTEPGLSGYRAASPNVSTRDILGVTGNGSREVLFNVPIDSAQDSFVQMPSKNVNLVTQLSFEDINNKTLTQFEDEFGTIDGVTFLDGKTVVFLNQTSEEWNIGDLYDSTVFDASGSAYDITGVVGEAFRGGIWKISVSSTGVLSLTYHDDFPENTKIIVTEGVSNSNVEYYKTPAGEITKVPVITAPLRTLYYQDAENSNVYGEIRIVQENSVPFINVNDIIGKKEYTSPNGVVFTTGLKVRFDTAVIQTEYADKEYYVEGVGKSISLIPVSELVTPETWTETLSEGYDTSLYDSQRFDGTFNSPVNKDYIVINRASKDRNPWARHNRWFHVDVINATAQYNNYTPVLNQTSRAKRPIIEYVPNLQLVNFASRHIANVTLIDTVTTDAFSRVEGTPGYFIDGVELAPGQTIVFAADTEYSVRRRVYRVDFVDVTGTGSTTVKLIDTGVLASDLDGIVVSGGISNQGKSFVFKDRTWAESQFKQSANTPVMFDIIDADGVSLGDNTRYPSTSFAGTSIFEYAPGRVTDTELGFGISYSSFSNIGDILFNLTLDTDTFTYIDNGTEITQNINTGNAYSYTSALHEVTPMHAWVTNYKKTPQYQILEFVSTGEPLEIRVPRVEEFELSRSLYVYIDNKETFNYTATNVDESTYVEFTSDIPAGKYVVVKFASNVKDPNSYYEIPANLESNGNNLPVSSFTLGQIRNHVNSITETHKFFNRDGNSNLRDLGDFAAVGGTITRHYDSFLTAAALLTDDNLDALRSLEYAQLEYFKFKNKFVDLITRTDYTNMTVEAAVSDAISVLNEYKSESEFPFYNSDMIGFSNNKSSIEYTVIDESQTEWELTSQFNLNEISTRAVYVYYNGEQLLHGRDYEFSDSRAAIITRIPLSADSTIVINEYTNTKGSFVPPTPSKMGLWPATVPEKVLDTSYRTPQEVIVGHDGSTMLAFSDMRDDLILEFEKRVYNNIKVKPILFDWYKLIPGAFRDTVYSVDEFNTVLGAEFNKWASRTSVKVTDGSSFNTNDPYTWNYAESTCALDGISINGTWRSVYRYLYDTETPHLTPWKMLGYSSEPNWWESQFGPAPYTAGNMVLWDRLANGEKYNPVTGEWEADPRFARPALQSIIPVDDFGRLLSPVEVVVKTYNSFSMARPLQFGDIGPAEYSWRQSSELPFAMCAVAALLMPSEFLSSSIQSSNVNTIRKFTETLVHSNENYVPGLIQYIVDYNTFLGVNRNIISEKISNVAVQLSHRLGGYSDLAQLKVVATRATPGSQNDGVLIPDTNLELFLHKSQPIGVYSYSAVIVEKTPSGYTVSGYDTSAAGFEIIPSVITSNKSTIKAGNATSTVYNDFNNVVTTIPYGTEFATRDQLVDFLVSYQRRLKSLGFVFDEVLTDGQLRDFVLSAKEFLFWTTQRWAPGSIIVLNPIGSLIRFSRDFEVVDDVLSTGVVLDNNFKPVRSSSMHVVRDANAFELEADNNIGLVKFRTVQYEHMLVLDNATIFKDVIYKPELGNRHQFIRLNGYVTREWNGTLYAPGFVLSQSTNKEWQPGKNYAKGEFVVYKGTLYVSLLHVDASESFDYNAWTVADKPVTGLLPNWSAKAQQPEDFYNIDVANLEQDVDRYGKGLIGYQKRSYLERLGLDDVSQVKFYQGMIKEKGTNSSLKSLLKTQVDNLTVDVDLYEEWALRTGSYGSIDSVKTTEIVLDPEKVTSTRSIIELVNNTSAAPYMQVRESDLWKKPANFAIENWPTVRSTESEMSLTAAGYVRPRDVNKAIVNVSDIKRLSPLVNEMYPGYTIWVAKSYKSEWDVLRATSLDVQVVAASVSNNGYLKLKFARSVNLDTNTSFAIKNFHSRINGVYTVLASPKPDEVVVDTKATNVDFTGAGIVLLFESIRIRPESTLSAKQTLSSFTIGEKLYVDSNSDSNWSVYNKTAPWTFNSIATLQTPTADQMVGQSIAILEHNVVAVTSKNNSAVKLFQVGPTATDELSEVQLMLSNIAGAATVVKSYGSTLAIGLPESAAGKGLVAIGSQIGADIAIRYVLAAPDTSAMYGSAIAFSNTGEWLFVGAPESGSIYAYNLVNAESQSQLVTINATGVYTLDNALDTESVVVQDNAGEILTPYVDYNISGNSLTVTKPYPIGTEIVVQTLPKFQLVDSLSNGPSFGSSVYSDSRGEVIIAGAPYSTVDDNNEAGSAYVISRSVENIYGDGSTGTFLLSETPNTRFKVTISGEDVTHTVTVSGRQITFAKPLGLGEVATVELNNLSIQQEIKNPEPSDRDWFGWAVVMCPTECSAYVSAPGSDNGQPNSGIVYSLSNKPLQTGAAILSPTNTGSSIRINNYAITYTNTEQFLSDINNIPGIAATDVSIDSTTLRVDVRSAAKLTITAPAGNSLADFGISKLTLNSVIKHPDESSNEKFGHALDLTNNGKTLLIGSPYASTFKDVTLDDSTTVLDAKTTRLRDREHKSGSVYVFEYVSTSPESGSFVPGQQLVAGTVSPLDEFGFALAAKGNMIVASAPREDTSSAPNAGTILVFSNSDNKQCWDSVRSQEDVVDISLIDRLMAYNKTTNTIVTYIDVVDPLSGRVLGQAQAELDYITEHDPAVYTNGDTNVNSSSAWAEEHVGEYWWDTSAVRYVNYKIGTLEERAQYWNKKFPGSEVAVYEWIRSKLPPAEFIESNPGAALKYSADTYTTLTRYSETDKTIGTYYYFWVRGLEKVAESKKLSASTVEQYIDQPDSTGIPYAMFLSSSAIALGNMQNLVSGRDTVLSVSFNGADDNKLWHNEYQLIKQGSNSSTITDRMYLKLKDSLAGATFTGMSVPDRNLLPSEKYGIGFRPRQSIVVNREESLRQLVEYVNNELRAKPYASAIRYNNLLRNDPAPRKSAKLWDESVKFDADLRFIDTNEKPAGYRVLVEQDLSESTLWTIRTLSNSKQWVKTRVQSYKTENFWSTVDWYAAGYSADTVVTHKVQSMDKLGQLSTQPGSVVLVASNNAGQFELHAADSDNKLVLVGLQNGTIQLSRSLYDPTVENVGFDAEVFDATRFDLNPVAEIHAILDAIREDIFINENVSKFNEIVFNLFELILAEQQNVDWLFKTSFISVEHKVRGLDQFTTYQPDNQTFLLDYINEVKPYRTKVREYLLKYDRVDTVNTSVSDFDIESVYDENLGIYRKLDINDPYDVNEFAGTSSEAWSRNYTSSIGRVDIVTKGSGYSVTPQIEISEPDIGTNRATAEVITRAGEVHKVNVINPGSGYITTPTVRLIGGNGTGARVVARLDNSTTRKIKTAIKFDRIDYRSQVQPWQPGSVYAVGDIVRYNNKAYRVIVDHTSADAFNFSNVAEVHADEFISANDRIAAFYQPKEGMLDNNLAQLVSGVDYPGSRVTGPSFDVEPGFDVAAFDAEVFDNYEVTADGITVLSSNVLDTNIVSKFTDSNLGLRPEDISVDGASFVDEYNSHHPEEFIPGMMFDTVDIKVMQAPSSNFTNNGNGLRIRLNYFVGDGLTTAFTVDRSDKVIVYSKERGALFANIDFTVDYINSRILFNTPLLNDETVYVYLFDVAGEGIVYNNAFTTTEEISTINVPTSRAVSKSVFCLVDGVEHEASITATTSGVVVTLATPIPAGHFVKLWVFNSENTIPYSNVVEDRIVTTANVRSYEISQSVLYTGPKSSHMIVELDGNRLTPANAKYYTADGVNNNFRLPDSADDQWYGISTTDIEVYRNDTRLQEYVNYTVTVDDGITPRGVILHETPDQNEVITVALTTNAQYRIINNNTIQISNTVAISDGSELRAISFTNHDHSDVQTKVFVGTTESTIVATVGFDDAPYDSIGYESPSVAVINEPTYVLDRDITDSNYLWVSVDGVKMYQGIDFTIDDNKVKINPAVNVSATSKVVITSFTENTAAPAMSWRVFKDMLDDVKYYAMAVEHTTALDNDLQITDTEIHVTDGSVLSEPSIKTNRPGVVFINGERITYWVKNGNVLSQIRRATAGTGAVATHVKGSLVIDASYKSEISNTGTNNHIWYNTVGSSLQFNTSPQAQFLQSKTGLIL